MDITAIEAAATRGVTDAWAGIVAAATATSPPTDARVRTVADACAADHAFDEALHGAAMAAAEDEARNAVDGPLNLNDPRVRAAVREPALAVLRDLAGQTPAEAGHGSNLPARS